MKRISRLWALPSVFATAWAGWSGSDYYWNGDGSGGEQLPLVSTADSSGSSPYTLQAGDMRFGTLALLSLSNGSTLRVIENTSNLRDLAMLHIEELSIESAGNASLEVGVRQGLRLDAVGSGTLSLQVTGELVASVGVVAGTQLSGHGGVLQLADRYDAAAYTTPGRYSLAELSGDWAAVTTEGLTLTPAAGCLVGASIAEGALQITVFDAAAYRRLQGGVVQGSAAAATADVAYGTSLGAAVPDATQAWTLQVRGTLAGPTTAGGAAQSVLVSSFDPGNGQVYGNGKVYGGGDFALYLTTDGNVYLMGGSGTGSFSELLQTGQHWQSAEYQLLLQGDGSHVQVLSGSLVLDGTSYALQTGAAPLDAMPSDGLQELYLRGAAGSSATFTAVAGQGSAPTVQQEWVLAGTAELSSLRAGNYAAVEGGGAVAAVLDDTTPLLFDGGTLHSAADASLLNPLSASAGQAIRFALADGSTLRVTDGQAALNSAGSGMVLTGGGTLRLENLAGGELRQLALGAGSRLELQAPAGVQMDTAANTLATTASIAELSGGGLSLSGGGELQELAAEEGGRLSLSGDYTLRSLRAGTLDVRNGSTAVGGSSYTGGMLTGVQLDANGATLQAAEGTSIVLADGASLTGGQLHNSSLQAAGSATLRGLTLTGSSSLQAAHTLHLQGITLPDGLSLHAGGSALTLTLPDGTETVTLSGQATPQRLTLTAWGMDARGLPRLSSRYQLTEGLPVQLADGAETTLLLAPGMQGELTTDAAGVLYLLMRRDEQAILDSLSALTLPAVSQWRGVVTMQRLLRQRLEDASACAGDPCTVWPGPETRLWMQADAAGVRTHQAGRTGLRDDAVGGSLGLECDFSQSWMLGAAGSAWAGKLRADGPTVARGRDDRYAAHLYARWEHCPHTHLFLLTTARNRMTLKRSLEDYRARSTPRGSSVSALYEYSYRWVLDEVGDHELRPYLSLSVTRGHISSAGESGDMQDELAQLLARNYTRATIEPGLRYRAVIGRLTDTDEPVHAELRLAPVAEFGSAVHRARVVTAGEPTRVRTLRGADSGSWGLLLGAGLRVPVGYDLVLHADAHAEWQQHHSTVSGSLGFTYRF